MRPTEQQLRTLSISPRSFDKLVFRGWVDSAGRALQWHQHQRPDHDRQFEEEKPRKEGKKKFTKQKDKEKR